MKTRVAVYISAGGASSRFGRDKARAALPDGQTLIEHVAAALAPIAETITVVADRADKFADLGLRTIADQRPGLGPLSGLHAALTDNAHNAWFFYIACDFVGFNHRWIEALLSAAEAAPDACAVAFRSPTHWEPVFALYNRRIVTQVIDAFDQEQRALWRLLDQVEAIALPLPEGWQRAKSINTPQDLDTYVQTSRDERITKN